MKKLDELIGQPKKALTLHDLGRCETCGEAYTLSETNRIMHECPAIAERTQKFQDARRGEVSSDTELMPPRRSYMDDDDE